MQSYGCSLCSNRHLCRGPGLTALPVFLAENTAVGLNNIQTQVENHTILSLSHTQNTWTEIIFQSSGKICHGVEITGRALHSSLAYFLSHSHSLQTTRNCLTSEMCVFLSWHDYCITGQVLKVGMNTIKLDADLFCCIYLAWHFTDLQLNSVVANKIRVCWLISQCSIL